MRKNFFKVLIVLATLFSVASCDLDFKGTYSFTNEYYFSFDNEDLQKEVQDYIESVIPNKTINPFVGAQYDAMLVGIEKFKENTAAIDRETIKAMLPDDDMQVRYALKMTGEKYLDYIGWITYDKSDVEAEPSTQQ